MSWELFLGPTKEIVQSYASHSMETWEDSVNDVNVNLRYDLMHIIPKLYAEPTTLTRMQHNHATFLRGASPRHMRDAMHSLSSSLEGVYFEHISEDNSGMSVVECHTRNYSFDNYRGPVIICTRYNR